MSSKTDFPYSLDPIVSKETLNEQKLRTIIDIAADAFIDLHCLKQIESSIICWIEAWQKARIDCEHDDLKENITEFIEYNLYEFLLGVNRRIASNLKNELRGEGDKN